MPGNSSIANSISRSGGSPCTSWKTSGKACTIGILLRSGSWVSHVSTVQRYAVHPLPINLQALEVDINGEMEVESPPLYRILSPSEVIKVRVFWLQSTVA